TPWQARSEDCACAAQTLSQRSWVRPKLDAWVLQAATHTSCIEASAELASARAPASDCPVPGTVLGLVTSETCFPPPSSPQAVNRHSRPKPDTPRSRRPSNMNAPPRAARAARSRELCSARWAPACKHEIASLFCVGFSIWDALSRPLGQTCSRLRSPSNRRRRRQQRLP